MSAKAGSPPPGWVNEALVGVADGPMVGQWFTKADWDARVETAKYMAARGQRRSLVLDYVPDGAMAHPHEDMASGTRMTHRPRKKGTP